MNSKQPKFNANNALTKILSSYNLTLAMTTDFFLIAQKIRPWDHLKIVRRIMDI